jgi:AhpD family alkylhydroperoxidase
MGRLIRTALRRTLSQIRHVTPVRPGRATGLVAEVYADIEADFGMLAPPSALHSPAPPVLAAAWSMLRETLVADGLTDRATREAVAASVSRSNTCPYCVVVHSATLNGLSDRSYPAIEAWASREAQRPFPIEQVPELLGVATTFHYLNRMVNIYLGESPLPPNAPAAAERFLGRFMGSHARKSLPPGTSLRHLPPAPTPDDLAWTAGNPVIADAFGRIAATMEEAGDRVLSPEAKELVRAEVAAWDGEPKGISRAWVADAVSRIPEDERPGATLALLTAMASYQVDTAVVAAFDCDDRQLVELTAWASFTAARRMAGLLHPTRATEV